MLFQTLPVTQPTHVYTKLLLFHPPTDRPTDLSPEIGEEVLRRRLPRRHRDAQPLQVVPGERVAVGDGVDAAVHGDGGAHVEVPQGDVGHGGVGALVGRGGGEGDAVAADEGA